MARRLLNGRACVLLLALVIAAPTLGACGDYVLTSDGIRAATLYIKLKNRLLRPCWTPTSRPPRSRPAARSQPSTAPSTNTSTTHASPPPHETRHNVKTCGHQVELARAPAKRRRRGMGRAG
jgi:hypothetical protein